MAEAALFPAIPFPITIMPQYCDRPVLFMDKLSSNLSKTKGLIAA
jgi:hypothetical protein